MCFKKIKIEDYMEYELDESQHGGIYKRTYNQWVLKHKLKTS